jgi:hypothetical protein
VEERGARDRVHRLAASGGVGGAGELFFFFCEAFFHFYRPILFFAS